MNPRRRAGRRRRGCPRLGTRPPRDRDARRATRDSIRSVRRPRAAAAASVRRRVREGASESSRVRMQYSFRVMSNPSNATTEADFDVIVVGAGHAGTEAAVAAARLGARVAIITSALETIGQMSCNPAIGGVAKGTVVREVDALGGIMGRATDLASLQFRMLNRSKGPAVWAPRSQCDRGLYRRAVRTLLEEHDRIHTVQGTVARLLLDEGGSRVLGVETLEGRRFGARSVVITTGTFL